MELVGALVEAAYPTTHKYPTSVPHVYGRKIITELKTAKLYRSCRKACHTARKVNQVWCTLTKVPLQITPFTMRWVSGHTQSCTIPKNASKIPGFSKVGRRSNEVGPEFGKVASGFGEFGLARASKSTQLLNADPCKHEKDHGN